MTTPVTAAATLRRAAELMRRDAERADPFATGRRWRLHVETLEFDWVSDGEGFEVAQICERTGAHIAGMDPTVTLALADWLDEAGRQWRDSRYTPGERDEDHAFALVVARAYLRDDQ